MLPILEILEGNQKCFLIQARIQLQKHFDSPTFVLAHKIVMKLGM